ncbi:UNVERIFIED_ORG: hypothetical protein BDK47_13228 [Anoxybacillus amylolyticus]
MDTKNPPDFRWEGAKCELETQLAAVGLILKGEFYSRYIWILSGFSRFLLL